MPIDPRNLVAGLGNSTAASFSFPSSSISLCSAFPSIPLAMESSSESESASSKLKGYVEESNFLIRVTLPEILMGVSIWYLATPVAWSTRVVGGASGEWNVQLLILVC